MRCLRQSKEREQQGRRTAKTAELGEKKNSALEIKVNKDVGGDVEKGEAGI